MSKEKIDLNDPKYQEFINVDYVLAMARQKENAKSNDNILETKLYREELNRIRIEIKKDNEKLKKMSSEKQQEYYDYLEYSGIPKEFRYDPNKKYNIDTSLNNGLGEIKTFKIEPFNFDE